MTDLLYQTDSYLQEFDATDYLCAGEIPRCDS